MRPGNDLLSKLLHGEDRLSAPQVLNLAMLLVGAGSETATSLIGNAALALLDHPDESGRARSSEDVLTGTIEETLRYDPPVQGVLRRASRNVELAGSHVPAGPFAM